MVGILAQVDDIFSWAPRGGKLIGTGWGMRIQGHGYLNILCRCIIRRSATRQRERGFLLDQHYSLLRVKTRRALWWSMKIQVWSSEPNTEYITPMRTVLCVPCCLLFNLRNTRCRRWGGGTAPASGASGRGSDR